ncbi:hypothetical protein BGZ91_009094, partial [Linnemannia elongata]
HDYSTISILALQHADPRFDVVLATHINPRVIFKARYWNCKATLVLWVRGAKGAWFDTPSASGCDRGYIRTSAASTFNTAATTPFADGFGFHAHNHCSIADDGCANLDTPNSRSSKECHTYFDVNPSNSYYPLC